MHYMRFIPFLIVSISLALSAAGADYKIELLSPSGRSATEVLINKSGSVVFTLAPEEAKFPGEAFLWDGDTTTSLGSLGGELFVATGINDGGQIVGYGETTNRTLHSFLFTTGQLQDLGPIGPEGSVARAINDLGDIVGELPANGSATVFLRNADGAVDEIGPPHGYQTLAFGVNDLKTVVGTSRMTNVGSFVAFVSRNQQMTQLGPKEGGESIAIAINDNEQIVGIAPTSAGAGHAAYFVEGGLHIDLASSSFRSSALAINNSGTIVGSIEYENGMPHAALFSLTADPVLLQDLISPQSGWTALFNATGVNDLGQIVGTGKFGNQPGLRAFLMTPIPEPSSLALVLGTTLLAALRRRR